MLDADEEAEEQELDGGRGGGGGGDDDDDDESGFSESKGPTPAKKTKKTKKKKSEDEAATRRPRTRTVRTGFTPVQKPSPRRYRRSASGFTASGTATTTTGVQVGQLLRKKDWQAVNNYAVDLLDGSTRTDAATDYDGLDDESDQEVRGKLLILLRMYNQLDGDGRCFCAEGRPIVAFACATMKSP